MYIWRLVLVL